jgi:hypothetical protein
MNRKIILLAGLSFLFNLAHAQFRTLSSANGEGRTLTPVFSQNRFAGQLSAAYVGNLVMNSQNPASYADASLTAIEAGTIGLSGSYTLNDSTKSSAGMGLSHFSILLPMTTGKSGMGIGFYHHANTNYGIKSLVNDTIFNIKDYNFKSGTGNLYNVFVGVGFRFKSWKFGANLTTQFGNNSYLNDTEFPDSTAIPTLRDRQSVSQMGMLYTLGTQYEWTINKTKQAIFGAYYNGTLFQSGSADIAKQHIFNRGFAPKEYISLTDTTQSVDIPSYSKFGIGASLITNRSFLLGTEFTYEDFSDFKTRIDNKNTNLQNAWHVHIGGEYKPFMNRTNDARKYFNRVTYRFGAVVGKSEQNYTGTINEYKIMGGATLPILGRNIGYITLGMEYGARGFGEKTQVSENLLSFHMILTFADKWFIRQKFD